MNPHKIFLGLLGFLIPLIANAYNQEHLEKFEKTGTCVSCDLSKANLSLRILKNSNLYQAILVEVNLTASDISSSNFNDAKMMNANLRNINASECNFSYADLSGANLSLILDNIPRKHPNFSGSDFTNANLTNTNFKNAILSTVNFKGADLTGADLTGAILYKAIISDEQLSHVKSLSCAIMPDGSRHFPVKGSGCPKQGWYDFPIE